MIKLSEFAATIPASPDGMLPVIFNGTRPRFLGFAESHKRADDLAWLNRVSATYNSRAEVILPSGKTRLVFILHS